MNPMRVFCLMACLVAATFASPNQYGSKMVRGHGGNSLNNKLKPTNWISASKLENLPALDEITFDRLEEMSLDEGAELIDTMYHLAQLNRNAKPLYNPTDKQIPAYIIKPNGENITTTLDKLAEAASEEPNFGDVETNVIITGLPQDRPTTKQATRKLVEAFMERCSVELQQQKRRFMDERRKSYRKSSYKDYEDRAEESNSKKWDSSKRISTCDVVVIDVADYCKHKSFECVALLDTEKVGETVGRNLVRVCEKANVPSEIINILGQQNGADVAGSAARTFKRLTNGQSIRRITALDPQKSFVSDCKKVSGLSLGDADFVDAIHTSAYGLGTQRRVGNVDFYPNGPNEGVPGAKNVIDASMRATRYYAESVRPGNEHNFPAVPTSSLDQLKSDVDTGKRGYMGLKADFDLSGDYMLKVNSKAPYGKQTIDF